MPWVNRQRLKKHFYLAAGLAVAAVVLPILLVRGAGAGPGDACPLPPNSRYKVHLVSATKDGVEQDLSSLVIAGMPSDATIIVDGAECKEASFWMFHPKTGDLLWDFAWVVP